MSGRRRSLLLAALLAAVAAQAQTPGGEERTRAAMERLCTELSLPCNSCGQQRGAGRGVGGDGIGLRSPGADGELGTGDDLVRACDRTEPAQ